MNASRYLPLMVAAVLLGILWHGVSQSEEGGLQKVFSSGTEDAVPLPSLALNRAEGDAPFELTSLKGQWTVIHVWGTWCGVCRAEFPVWNQIAKRYSEVPLVSVNVQDSPSAVIQWFKQHGDPFQHHLLDKDNRFSAALRIRGVPTTLLVDPNGLIRYKHMGNVSMEIFESSFLRLIKGENQS